MKIELIIGTVFGVLVVSLYVLFCSYENKQNHCQDRAITERNRVYLVERGAEDDAGELALSEHQEVNYVRCYLRAAGHVTCQVHTPPVDVEAICRARRDNELLVDGTRCRWVNPAAMAHPEVIRQ